MHTNCLMYLNWICIRVCSDVHSFRCSYIADLYSFILQLLAFHNDMSLAVQIWWHFKICVSDSAVLYCRYRASIARIYNIVMNCNCDFLLCSQSLFAKVTTSIIIMVRDWSVQLLDSQLCLKGDPCNWNPCILRYYKDSKLHCTLLLYVHLGGMSCPMGARSNLPPRPIKFLRKHAVRSPSWYVRCMP